MKTEIITGNELKKYLGLLDNMEISGMENGRYTCFGAFDDKSDKGIGILVAESLPDYILVKRIFVLPEYRRKGVATALLKIVTDLPEDLKQPVITYGAKEELDKKFLDAMGFKEVKSDYTYIEGTLGDYRKLHLPAKKSEYKLIPAEKITTNALKKFIFDMKKKKNIKLQELFVDDDTISDESIVCMKNNKIAAVIMLEESDGNVMLPLVFGKDTKAILYCFSAFYEILSGDFGPEECIRILLNKDIGKEAIEKIIGNTTEKKVLIYKL
ncbi:MAG: GNAT family N-acetyltransferase [Lachnospiraceae bacterium]|nr:GNAT family N-acetyltransferase [Lachnospiraceae bacterium]